MHSRWHCDSLRANQHVLDCCGAQAVTAVADSRRVCTEKSDPDVLAVQSTEDRVRYDASDALNGA